MKRLGIDPVSLALVGVCLALLTVVGIDTASNFTDPVEHEAVYVPGTITDGFDGFRAEDDISFYEPKTTPVCDVTKHGDWTQRDFKAPGKESRGALGPALNVRKGDSRDRVNAIVHGIICGNEERGANQHVLEGIMAAFYDGEIRHLTHNEWVRTAHTVMEALWIPQRTRVFCGNDKPGHRTVYAHEGHDGQLRLATTTIRAPRHSCYVWLSFMSPNAHEGPQALRLRANCGLQATTLSGEGAYWRMPSPQG